MQEGITYQQSKAEVLLGRVNDTWDRLIKEGSEDAKQKYEIALKEWQDWVGKNERK